MIIYNSQPHRHNTNSTGAQLSYSRYHWKHIESYNPYYEVIGSMRLPGQIRRLLPDRRPKGIFLGILVKDLKIHFIFFLKPYENNYFLWEKPSVSTPLYTESNFGQIFSDFALPQNGKVWNPSLKVLRREWDLTRQTIASYWGPNDSMGFEWYLE